MYSSDDDILMETNGNDSSSSDFGKAISRKKRKKAIENTEHHPSKHMKHQNMQNVLETFACEVCSKTFKYKKGLARHLNSEHMEVQTSFPCESCSKSFKYKQTLTVHIKSQHADVEARFSCEACPKTFKYKQDLTIHFNSKHMEGTGEKFNCEICLKTFQNKKGLTKHVKSVHIKCKWCDYQSQNKDEDMEKHYWNTHQEKVVQEEIDEANFANGFEKKTQKPHKCGWCRDRRDKRLCTTREDLCCVRSWIALIKNPIKYGHYRGIQDGHDILICSSCYNRILICDKIPNSPSYWDNRLTRSYIYNFSERAGNSYKVTFYNSTIIRITADPKPCRLCRDPVGELKDPHWSTDPTFLENKHILLLCPDPVMREPRKRILTELSSLLMEESTEPHPTLNYVSTTTTTKSLDSTTINGIFSDETVLAELFINPTSSNLPTAYRFKSYDPKYSRISALRRELYKIYCDQFNLLFTPKNKMNTTKSSS